MHRHCVWPHARGPLFCQSPRAQSSFRCLVLGRVITHFHTCALGCHSPSLIRKGPGPTQHTAQSIMDWGRCEFYQHEGANCPLPLFL